MRRVDVQESREQLLELSADQAQALQRVGRRLASKKHWWGADDVEDAEERRSAISCVAAGASIWRVTVANSVGLINVGDLQVAVHPKIPTSHLLYLLGRSGHFPRLDDDRALAIAGSDLWNLVAYWFVLAAEQVMRRDLIRDYELVQAELPVIRGRVGLLDTAADVYRGRLAFRCEYDELAIDTPLNRLLKAAARVVAASDVLRHASRRRAMRLLARMDEIGDLRPGDELASIDRRSGHYVDARSLAKHVLQRQGRVFEHGAAPAWTFLIPTPRLVEDGVRNLLVERLTPAWDVRKRGMQLEGSTLTFNPDLLFQHGLAVGDVKYKLLAAGWSRPDLYEVISFATGYRSRHCVVLAFRNPNRAPLRPLRVGDVDVTEIAWAADPDVDPSTAAAEMATDVRDWLVSLPTCL
jgi:hypothetical protein